MVDAEGRTSRLSPAKLAELIALLEDETADEETRAQACMRLRHHRLGVRAIAAALKGNKERVAIAAAAALGFLRSRLAAQALIEAMETSPWVEVRYGAANSLGFSRDKRAVAPLLRRLEDKSENERVRGQAAEALRDVKKAMPNLIRALSDPSAEVRFWSVYALSQMWDPSAIPHLLRLKDDPARVPGFRSVGEEAQWAISHIQGWVGHDRPEATDWLSVRYGDFENMTGYGNGRVERTAAALREQGVDALLLTPGADQFYLSGFEHTHAFRRLLALVVRADGSLVWIAPTMNASQIEAVGLGGGVLRTWTDAETYLPALREETAGLKSIAFDNEARSEFLLDLLNVNPSVKVVKAGEIMTALRMRKDAEELRKLRVAGKTVDDTITEAISFCVAGRTEAEVDELLRKALLRRSPESSIGFSIVASGENSALPHHDTGTRTLEQGDVVILDYGTKYEGYHSDITVTCSVGEPADPEVRKVYRVVWEAQQKALEAVRPGVACEDIDRAARGHIEAAGYGDFFLHRTGHGLGLQIHEAPFMVGGAKQRLDEGMVFSVEPGIYLKNRFGIRLEVIASVAADGVSLINAPRVSELPLSPA